MPSSVLRRRLVSHSFAGLRSPNRWNCPAKLGLPASSSRLVLDTHSLSHSFCSRSCPCSLVEYTRFEQMTATTLPAPGTGPAEELWRHPDPTSTPMWRFMQHVNNKHGLSLETYADLYAWSVDDVAFFWGDVWGFVGVNAEKGLDHVIPPEAKMYPRPDFFQGSLLNYAENLLYPMTPSPIDPSSPAVITTTELPSQTPRTTSWGDLRASVRRCAAALRSPAVGLKSGDVVAGYVSNHVEALVAMLAAASVGAIWTGISPDNGVSAVLDRLEQIRPRVLFADNGTVYNGKEWSSTAKTTEIVATLRNNGLENVIVIKNISADLALEDLKGVKAVAWDSLLDSAPPEPLHFEKLPPSHPLYILFSSGTTGLPKAIIHTAAGTLLQHKKELMLHCSMSTSSRMLYYTTTSWMMWHWSIAALSCGSTLVLYSGSPFRPHSHMSIPKLLSDLKVTHFGTSAAYLTALEANAVYPVRDSSVDLSNLQAIYSTASPLPPSTFKFVYEAFPKHINLGSITGGTDIISLFGAPCPLLPVRTGEIQCAGLGMAIRVVDSLTGEEVPPGDAGDLICAKPFPCQPLTFFGPNGDDKYKSAYFERFADVCGAKGAVWHHGDFVKIPDARTGGLLMLGRSDGVLKPSGVRFGSAEIYNILTRFFASEIEDAVCVGRRRAADMDETVCLFVVMVEGKSFDDGVRARVKAKIKSELSPRHAPGVVEECGGGIPKTSNGKKIEVAVKQILSGMQVKTNASVANPEALEWFKEWAESQ